MSWSLLHCLLYLLLIVLFLILYEIEKPNVLNEFIKWKNEKTHGRSKGGDSVYWFYHLELIFFKKTSIDLYSHKIGHKKRAGKYLEHFGCFDSN
jgi:hypothetical protein